MITKVDILTTLALAAALGAVAPPAPAVAAESGPVAQASSPEGTVWVSIDLARQRTDEAYVPFLVVVYNSARESVTLDRDSFRVLGADRREFDLATLQEIRRDYGMQSFDLTMGRFYGIPVGSKLDVGWLVPSNFFPVLGSGSGIMQDEVELATHHWTVDLLYFARPTGLAEGREVVLEVAPEGWEAPTRVPIRLD